MTEDCKKLEYPWACANCDKVIWMPFGFDPNRFVKSLRYRCKCSANVWVNKKSLKPRKIVPSIGTYTVGKSFSDCPAIAPDIHEQAGADEDLPNEKATKEWMITNLKDIKDICSQELADVFDLDRIAVKVDAIIEHLKSS